MAFFKQKVKLEDFCVYTFRKSFGSKEKDDYYKNMFKTKESYEKNFKVIEVFIQLTSTLLFISHILYCYKTGEIKGTINSISKRIVDSAQKIYNEFEYYNNPIHEMYQADFLEDLKAAFVIISSSEGTNNFSNDLCEYIIEKYESEYDELGFVVGYFVNYESAIVIKTMINNMAKIKIVN